MATWLTKNVDGAEIYLLSQYWQENESYYRSFGWHSASMLWDIPMMNNKFKRLCISVINLLKVIVKILWPRVPRSHSDTVRLYKKCDIILDAGGWSLYSSNKYRFYLGLYQHLFNLYAGKLLGKKVVIAPQSIGPLYRRQDIWCVRKVLSILDKVYVREDISLRLLNDMGVDCSLAPDCAFLGGFSQVKSQNLRSVIDEIQQEQYVKIGLTVLNWSWAAPRRVDQNTGMNSYLESIRDALFVLHKDRKVKVYLYSHADVEHTVSDHTVSKEMEELLMGAGVPVEVMSPKYTASDLYHLYEKMNLMVGSRMHSSILSLMAGIPTVNLAYQPKAVGVFDYAGLNQYVLDAYSFSSDDLLITMRICLDEVKEVKIRVRASVNAATAECSAAFSNMLG
jgi:colanic acid/amylovoran biosynthesis protein